MKKILFALSAVALLFATSCKKESVNPAIDVPEGSFLATIDNGANPQNAPRINDGMGTMTTIDNNRYVIWDSGDQIKINGVAYTTGMSGNQVVFTPTDQTQQATGTAFHAFYPESIAGDGAAGSLQAIQTYESGKVSNLPMYAYSTNNQLTFHNICAALKITIPSFVNGATRIVISSDQQMNGSFTVQGDSAFMNKQTLDEADKMVTIAKTSGTFATNEVVYIAVPANTYSNFKVEFFNGTASMWTKTIENKTFLVNKVYNLNATPMGLCFTARSNSPIIIKMQKEGEPNDIYLEYCTYTASTGYSIWQSYTIGNDITLNKGDKVYFRAETGYVNTTFCTDIDWDYYYFTCTPGRSLDVSGNIMYLLSQNPATTLTSQNEKAFAHLFESMSSLVNAKDLLLPATTLANYCYYYMFYSCAALETAPELKATTLANNCYESMFSECYALTTAPVLPATTLVDYCYNGMFNGCYSLSAVTMLATNVSASYCLYDWLEGAGDESALLTINSSITDITSGTGKTIADNTPDNWAIKAQGASSNLRDVVE